MEEYAKSVRDMVANIMGGEYEVRLTNVLKNNGQTQKCLSIKKRGEDTALVTPLNDAYESDVPVLDAVFGIIDSYRHHPAPNNVSDLEDYNNVKDRIFYELVNKSSNTEFLSDKPHKDVLGDLVLVYRVLVKNDKQKGTVAAGIITNQIMDIWGVTVEELDAVSRKNMPRLFPPIIKNMPAPIPVFVLSNKIEVFGASSILYPDLITSVGKIIGSLKPCNILMIPCSVREWILVPELDNELSIPIDELTGFIKFVNGSSLDAKEVLSDHPYRYMYETGEIVSI